MTKVTRNIISLMLMLTIGTTSVLAQTNITSLSQITDANGSYIITQDISGGTTGVTTFSGTLTAQANNDGTYPVISNITQPLFATATNATISNIMFKGISISGSGNIGAHQHPALVALTDTAAAL